MNNKVKLLSNLLKKRTQKKTIRQLSLDTKLNYRTTYYIIQELKEEGSITLEKVGQASLISLNLKCTPSLFEAESERKKTILEKKDISTLFKKASSKNPFFVLLLFGSYAKGEEKKGSDIDLCCISDSETLQKEIEEKLTLLPLPIQFQHFSSGEFKKMLEKKELSLAHELKESSIILHGVEEFYTLIGDERAI